MIVDLHSHYPMHLLAQDPDTVKLMTSPARGSFTDKFRATVLRLANRLANYQGKNETPAVTTPSLAQSNIRVALSVLTAPFDEIDLDEKYGAPPRGKYFTDLVKQIDMVEQHVATQSGLAGVAHNQAELQTLMAAGKVALIHAIEGGFHLGETPQSVSANVATLASRGVAYITIAHLFWRQVATNAPALPFISDSIYSFLFPQPKLGLTELGTALVNAMIQHRILIDVSHMSTSSLDQTLELLDQADPNRTIPLIATHTACGSFSRARYNLDDRYIDSIARRQGVVGLIACRHWMAQGFKEPKRFADTMDLIRRHIDHIHDVVQASGDGHRCTAFGSDQDGFIKPALPGLETPAGFAQVEEELARQYGASVAEQICSGNALRVLKYWGQA